MSTTEPEQTEGENDATSDDSVGEQLYETVGPHAGRRDVLKGIAAASAAAAGGTATVGSASAQVDEDDGALVKFGTRVDAGSDAIKGVVTGDWVEFDTPYSESEAETALADNLHDSIYRSGVEVANWTDLHLTSVENQTVMMSDYIRNNVQYRVVEEAYNGATLEETKAAAVEEAEEQVAQMEANFIQAWNEAILTVSGNWRNAVLEESALDISDVILRQGYNSDGNHFQSAGVYSQFDDYGMSLLDAPEDGDNYRYGWTEYPLANGETQHFARFSHYDLNGNSLFFAPVATWPNSSPPYNYDDFDEDFNTWGVEMLEGIRTWSGPGELQTAFAFEERDGSDGSLNSVVALDTEEWMEVHSEIMTLRQEETQYANDIAETLYEPASNGEITPEEVSGAAAIMEVADTDEWEHANEAAAIYRSVGMPEGEDAVVVETGGNTYEGVLFWTLPNDEAQPFEVGEEIDPGEVEGSFYLAAEVVDVAEPDEVAYPVEFALRESEGGESFSDATVQVLDDEGNVIAEEEDPTDGSASLNVQGGSNREFRVTWTDSNDELVEVTQMRNVDEGLEVVVYRDTQSMEIFESEDWIGYEEPAEGDIVASELLGPFTITGTESGDPLEFPERDLIEPDASQEEMINRLIEALEKEQESQKELEVTITEDSDGGGGGGAIVGEDDDWVVWLAGLFGVGFIGALILAAANAFDGLLPDINIGYDPGDER